MRHLVLLLLLAIIAHCVLAKALVFTLLWFAEVEKGLPLCGLGFGNGRASWTFVPGCITHIAGILGSCNSRI